MNILDFIAEIRESFYGAEYVYKNGSCFKFADLLRKMYGGEVVDLRGHCVLRLDNKLYDITGELELTDDLDITQLDLEPASINFYTSKYSRFDSVLDSKGLVYLPITPDQIQTLIVREAQSLRFGQDLSLVRYMVENAIKFYNTRINFDIRIFDRELTQQERAQYDTTHTIVLLNHDQSYLTFCLGEPTC